jgi:hypothetical protein
MNIRRSIDRSSFHAVRVTTAEDMGAHMKTTVEIPDAVLNAVRELARRDNTTVQALIKRGLRRELAQADRSDSFKLRRASVGGYGLRDSDPDVQ